MRPHRKGERRDFVCGAKKKKKNRNITKVAKRAPAQRRPREVLREITEGATDFFFFFDGVGSAGGCVSEMNAQKRSKRGGFVVVGVCLVFPFNPSRATNQTKPKQSKQGGIGRQSVVVQRWTGGTRRHWAQSLSIASLFLQTDRYLSAAPPLEAKQQQQTQQH
eukprot:TRINITY_DN15906_c0_g1_i1.p1 TRINITY_DN15906_c0_g1~~TRINITY_DN15906_c0_g1_i1.p1  ORF type:complete len:163 (+),score=16.90 TRINITY_DN15906_c0_g1_i1:334-822(+)